MVYESAYESGQQPFLPDAERGHWTGPHDFIYACISFAFRIDLFVWYMSMIQAGVVNLIPGFLVGMVIFIVPFMMLQSFMGQFSSSGFISAFRVSPLFKGIGYVTLAVNICVLTFYSVYAVVPLAYMFASLNPTLPWSCEGFKQWATNLTEREETNLCNLKINASFNGEDSSNSSSYSYYVNHHIPSVLYFAHIYGNKFFPRYKYMEFAMAWQLMLCALIVWALVAFIVYKFFDTGKFGTMIRYFVWTLLGLLSFLLLRFSFFQGSGKAYYNTFVPTWYDFSYSFLITPVYCISTFGPGWGLFITLSSYNKFKGDLLKSCWIIGLGQFALTCALSIFSNLTEMYFGEITQGNYYSRVESIWTLYLSSGSAMVHMEWANMWSVLFYFMLFLAALTLMLIQLNSILRTITDEFVSLREKKFQVSMGLIAFMAACSLYFTSNQGTEYLNTLATDTFITQTAINLLLVLVILWIYGRVRFQRDIEFMTGRSYSTWMVNILRFVTPLAMLCALAFGFFVSHYEHRFSTFATDIIAILCIGIPWICIPAYALYQKCLGMGPIKIRFFRCCRPTDWYPVELEHRQKYEEAVGSPEINQTFNELKDQEDL